METITLKKTVGGTSYVIDALYVRPFPEVDSEKYVSISNVRNEVINAKWKKWEVRFAKLNLIQLEMLEDLPGYTDVQFIYGATTYTVEVDKVNARAIGGSIILINRQPEA